MRGRLVRDAYRGWYGWEDRYNAIIRMSFESMNNTNARNKQERFRHLRRQKQLEKQQLRHVERLEREMQEIKDELRSARAYSKVCRRYSYYSLEEREGDEGGLKDETVSSRKRIEKGQKVSKRERNSHKGSSREARGHAEGLRKDKERNCKTPATEWQQGEGKALADGRLSASEGDCYVVSNDTNDRERTAYCVEIDGKGQLVDIGEENKAQRQLSEGIEDNKKVTGSHGNVFGQDNPERGKRRNSSKKVTFAAEIVPKAEQEGNNDDVGDTSDKLEPESRDRLRRTLILAKWSRALDIIINNNNIVIHNNNSSSNSNVSTNRSRRQDGHPRESKDNDNHSPDGTKPRRRHPTAFPAQCRNTFSLRRFIQREVEHLLATFTPERARREKVTRILEKSRFPDLVQRDRSTSAIFRNYQTYRRTSAYRRNNTSHEQLKPAQANEYSLKKLKEKYEKLNNSRQVLLLPSLVEGRGAHVQRAASEKHVGMARKNGIRVLSEKKVVVLPTIEQNEYVS